MALKTFQFSVSMKDALPPSEVYSNGQLVLSDVVQAETINDAISKLETWLNTNNYRVYKVRK